MNWKWLLAVAFLGCIVFAVGIFALIIGVMRNSDVAQQAVARAQTNPAVSGQGWSWMSWVALHNAVVVGVLGKDHAD